MSLFRTVQINADFFKLIAVKTTVKVDTFETSPRHPLRRAILIVAEKTLRPARYAW